MEILWIILFVVLLIAHWAMVNHRFEALDERIATMPVDAVSPNDFAALVKRVRLLEAASAPPPPAPPPVFEPNPIVVERPREPWTPASEPEPGPIPEPQPAPPPLPRTVVFADPAPSQPTLGERFRKLLGDDEWEALVGGSLLNKLGALVLVIGIALFLGYSFAHVTAAGRATISLVVSALILGSGVWVERRPRFKVFSRGLIGAGWAALYATSYAIYSIPEARIIDNPYLGSALALLVALGMIAHSLRYRVQAITAVAYFAAFAALAVTPATPFAVISLIPLAASLLYLAARFNWLSMAVFGIAATYLTCIYRGDSGAPLLSTQALFLTYWLIFEAFDLLRTQRRLLAGGVEFLFVLNTGAFLGLSYLTWSNHAPERLWMASAAGAALFLASAIVRAGLRPPEAGEDLIHRLRAGSYEGPLLISAALAGFAIVARASGMWTGVGLAVEAEILYLAGVRFESRFLRGLGATGFAVSLAKVGLASLSASMTPLFGHLTYTATPAVLFHAALFYFNRALRRPNTIFSSAAAILIAGVLFAEVPASFIGTAFVLFGVALFELGVWKKADEFCLQAYALLGAGTLVTIGYHPAWLPLAISLAAIYVVALRLRGTQAEPLLSYCASGAVTVLALALLWRTLPPDYVALSWAGLVLLLFELGNLRLPSELRLTVLPMSLITAGGVIATQPIFAKFPPHSVSLTCFGVCLAFWIASVRLESSRPRDFLTSLGAVFALIGIWLVVPDAQVPLGWMLLAAAFLLAGLHFSFTAARWLSYGITCLACLAWLIFDFSPPRLQFSIPVVAILYAAQFLGKRAQEKYAPLLFSGLGTVLLAALLYGQFNKELTVAWGLEGLALLGAGFLLRDRLFRIEGLILLLVCISKLFLYDLRNLETVYRILSFVALGLILLAVSWIYTRFRDHVTRFIK